MDGSQNHIYGSQETAISLDRGWGTIVIDNYIEDFGNTSADGTYRGIMLRAHGDGAGSTIAGNLVLALNASARDGSSSYRFVEVAGLHGTPAVAVTGNVIRSTVPTAVNRSAFWFSGATAESLAITSSGNAVTGFSERSRRVIGRAVSLQPGR